MLHTLLTFTPFQDASEDAAAKGPLNCNALTQTLGPLPLASLDANGWAIWEHKVVLVDGYLIQIAPVVNGQVTAPTYCFDVQSRQQAVRLSIIKDTQNAGLFYIQLDPMGNTTVSPLNNTIRLSNSAANNQPVPSLQIISVRDKYMTSAQTHSLDFIGTMDTRAGRNAKIVFGNTVTIWSEQDALMFEWSIL
jgi:hypothetical protein